MVRWLSLSNLLESIHKSFKIIKKLFIARQKQYLINDINEPLMKQLIMLLKPFKNMMKLIQLGNSPSIHLVALCYISLRDLLNSYELLKQYYKDNNDEGSMDLSDDDDLEHELPGETFDWSITQNYHLFLELKWFRHRLLLLLKEMFVLDIRHVAATLLHPHYRCLRKFPDDIKNRCHRFIREQIKKLREESEIEVQLQQDLLEPSVKKFKDDNNFFSRFESGSLGETADHNESSSGSEEFAYDMKKGDELDRYLLYEFEKNKETEQPLLFWKIHRNQFPFLAQYARSIFFNSCNDN